MQIDVSQIRSFLTVFSEISLSKCKDVKLSKNCLLKIQSTYYNSLPEV